MNAQVLLKYFTAQDAYLAWLVGCGNFRVTVANMFIYSCLDVLKCTLFLIFPAYYNKTMSGTQRMNKNKTFKLGQKTHLFAVLNYPILASLPEIT